MEVLASTQVHAPYATIDKQPSVKVDSGRTSPHQPVEETPLTIDHLIKITVKSSAADEPLIAYPDNGTKYTTYTPRELDNLVEQAAVHYSTVIPQRMTSREAVKTVALLGLSDLSSLIAILAVARLGHASLLLSTRITEEAYESLIKSTEAAFLLHGDAYSHNAAAMSAIFPALGTAFITDPRTLPKASDGLPVSRLDLDAETSNVSFIIHSSGSTGLPKPIVQTHKACIHNYAQNFGLVGYCTLPLYHNHGISCLFRAIHSRQMIYLYSARSALTSSHLVTTLQEHRSIEILYAVPYALKLLSESAEGIALLAKLNIVMFGGSACPKPIGDALVAQGVNLVGHYGATEVGQLMTSMRDYTNDSGWDWLRVPPHLEPFLSMEARGQGVFELCIRDGWPSKVASNREDNSYATKDLFEPHETLPNAWRYYARLDDTITLENGEKANPLLIEGTIRQNRHVAEVVVFGVGKPRLGAMVIPAATSDLSDAAIIDELAASISRLNDSVPAYSQLSTDMIAVLPRDAVYRATDKGTVIRAAFYRDYADHIERAYREESSGTLVLSYPELVTFLEEAVQSKVKRLEFAHIDPDTDLFSLGVDSLQSLQIRSSIVKHLNTGSSSLGRNFIFDFPTLRRAANELLRLQHGGPDQAQPSLEERMQAMIERYSCFEQHYQSDVEADGEYIVITGATGSLGAHTVAKLALQDHVRKIFCLVRASDHKTALQRVRASLRQRQVYHTLHNIARRKIVAIPSDCFGQDRCGLSTEDYETIRRQLTRVIHLAWSVNFNKTLESFEQDCIAGTRNLINLCQASRLSRAAAFYFCSSVSATAATSGGAVAEALPSTLSAAQGMGYAQSKLVAEHICMRAVEQVGLSTQVLRVGQIIGDNTYGIWNATEAIPMILQTAKTVGALPKLDERPAWLPVDTVADSIVEITQSAADSGVMNIVNHKTFHWTDDLLPLLKQSGLKFEAVSQQEWIRRLRQSNPDPEQNPPIKLVDFFAGKYDTQEKRRGCVHATQRSRHFSQSLANSKVIDLPLVKKVIAQFEQTAWFSCSVSGAKPLVIVLGGPCGSGKSTIAAKLSSALQLPLIEGDDLHSDAARKLMATHIPLTDHERQLWLAHVRGAVMDRLVSTRARAVVVTCSALKSVYRDQLRMLQELVGARILFVMLSAGDADTLRARMQQRQDHYMDAVMVDEQVRILEEPRVDEVDVVPVDASASFEDVYEEVSAVVTEAMQ